MAHSLSISGQEFCFERLDWPSERDAYIEAWKKAFSRDGYEDRIDWLIGSPLNRTYIIKNNTNSIVAAYSLIKNRMFKSGSIVESAICNNVFCVPEFQGLNLFVRLGRLSLSDAASDYEFAYGFPNSLAIAGHRRVGWKVLTDACNISIKLIETRGWTLGKFAVPIMVEDFSESDRKHICKEMEDATFAKVISIDKPLSPIKTKDYIYWRFFDRPKTADRTYYVLPVPKAYMLFSIYHPRSEINILDFQPLNHNSEQFALQSLYLFARRNKIKALKLFGCRKSELPHKLISLMGKSDFDIHYENVSMIVNQLGNKDSAFQESTPCPAQSVILITMFIDPCELTS